MTTEHNPPYESFVERRDRLFRECLSAKMCFDRYTVTNILARLKEVEDEADVVRREIDEDWQAFLGVLGESGEFAGGPWSRVAVRKLKGGTSTFINQVPRGMDAETASAFLLSQARCYMQLLDQAEHAEVFGFYEPLDRPALTVRREGGVLYEYGKMAGLGPLPRRYLATNRTTGAEIRGVQA